MIRKLGGRGRAASETRRPTDYPSGVGYGIGWAGISVLDCEKHTDTQAFVEAE